MKKFTLVSFLLSALSIPLKADVKIGESAPKITGVSETGEKIELASHYSKGYVLVYFYPKADTPGCTAQACSLRDAYATLQNQGVTIFGVSTDSAETQFAFKKKHSLPFTLIADTDKVWAKAFGVPMILGFAKRQAFLIHEGKVVWLDRSASTAEQAKDIIKVLEERKASLGSK